MNIWCYNFLTSNKEVRMQCYKIFTICKFVKVLFYNIIIPRGEYFIAGVNISHLYFHPGMAILWEWRLYLTPALIFVNQSGGKGRGGGGGIRMRNLFTVVCSCSFLVVWLQLCQRILRCGICRTFHIGSVNIILGTSSLESSEHCKLHQAFWAGYIVEPH